MLKHIISLITIVTFVSTLAPPAYAMRAEVPVEGSVAGEVADALASGAVAANAAAAVEKVEGEEAQAVEKRWLDEGVISLEEYLRIQLNKLDKQIDSTLTLSKLPEPFVAIAAQFNKAIAAVNIEQPLKSWLEYAYAEFKAEVEINTDYQAVLAAIRKYAKNVRLEMDGTRAKKAAQRAVILITGDPINENTEAAMDILKARGYGIDKFAYAKDLPEALAKRQEILERPQWPVELITIVDLTGANQAALIETFGENNVVIFAGLDLNRDIDKAQARAKINAYLDESV